MRPHPCSPWRHSSICESNADSVEVQAAARFRAWVHELFDTLATDLGASDPDRLAKQLVVLYDGATTTAQMDKTAAPAGTAREMATILLAGAPVAA